MLRVTSRTHSIMNPSKFSVFFKDNIKNLACFCVAASALHLRGLQAATVIWSGASGTDTNWSNAANWSGGVPGGGDDAKFFDAGSATFPTTNNVVDANLTIGTLQYGNTNNSHTTFIADGVALTITNTGGLIAATAGDIGVARFLTNVITGAKGALIVTNPSAAISVSQGGAAGSSSEILNMTKLAAFTANINRIGIGTSTSFNPGNSGNKLAGALYLAQTNFIALGLTDTLANYQTSVTRTNSIEISRTPSNNGAVASYLYLGQTNIIYMDSIGIGLGKENNNAYGWMGFNPAFINSVAYFRGVSGGTNRVTWWSIGDGLNVASSSNGGVGTNDFSNGTVDALIDVLSLGRDCLAADQFGGPHRGVLTFNSGTIDANTAIIGNQSLETTNSKTPCLGVVNVGSAAVFRVNSGITLGYSAIALTSVTNTAGAFTSGILAVNGGTVYANNILVGTNSATNFLRLASATLIVTNTMATNVSSLNLGCTNSIIGLSVPLDGSLRCLAKTLATGGATNLILLDSAPVFFASYPQQFPLIKYTTWTGANNFGLTNTPFWAVGAALVSNGPNASLDLRLPADPRPIFISSPLPYSGNPGDNVTTNFTVNIAASSVTPLGYQWYSVIAGVTNQLSNGPGHTGSTGTSTLSGCLTNNLIISNAQTNDSGNYFVVVTNICGTNTSSQALLTISPGSIPPAITAPPTLTGTNGITTTIVDSVSGSPVPVLYWQFNGNLLTNGPGPSGSSTISGASGSTLTISNPQYPGDQGTYTLFATNIAGTASSNTVVTVLVPPIISVQPTNLTVTNTQSASFSVTASGVPSPTYQWYKNGLGSPISSLINPSAITSNLVIASTSPSDIATYFVVVQNAAGSVTSSNAALIVNSLMSPAVFSPTNGATGICYDTTLAVTFSSAPTLRTAGTIKIYNVTNNATPVDTIDLSIGSPQPRAIGGDTFNSYPVMVSGSTAAIYPHSGVLKSNATYYVKIDNGVFADSTGAYFVGITTTNAWQFTTKPGGPVNPTNLVIAADGSGDFATVQGAVDSVALNSITPTKLNIRNGTYKEIIDIKSRNNLDLRGQSRNGVVIGYPDNDLLNPGAPLRSCFVLNGNDCTLETLTLTNMTPSGGSQAEAVDVEGTRAIFYNMELDSYQDTFLVHSAGKLVYFQDSLVQGQTDFNWGYGTVYYTNCEIRCLLSGGHVTQPRSPQGSNGFAFVNCRITKGYTGASTFDLGRTIGSPTSPSEVLFANCLMDDVVTGYASDAGTNMADYACSNLTATAAKSLAFSTHSTSSDPFVIAAQSAVTWLYGWQPVLAPNVLANPASVTVSYGQSTNFSASATGIPDPSYQWQHAGTNLPGATSATLPITSAQRSYGGGYAVIVSNSSGSVTSIVATLTYNDTAPVVNPSTYSRPAGYPLNIPIVGNLAAYWSDADGDPLTLTGSIISTNGAAVNYDSTYVYYTNANNLVDVINYTVSDGFGGNTAGIVNVLVGPPPTNSIASAVVNGNGTVTLSFAGVPNYTYQVESTTNLTPPTVWLPVSTNTADINGLWQFTDSQATNYSMRFYRSLYNP